MAKQIDLFLRGGKQELNVYLNKRISNIEIALKNNITNCDIRIQNRIQNLPKRIVFTAANRIAVASYLSRCYAIKAIDGMTRTGVRLRVDALIEECRQQLRSGVAVGTSIIDAKSEKFSKRNGSIRAGVRMIVHTVRPRLLRDMQDKKLSDYENMSLEEISYIDW